MPKRLLSPLVALLAFSLLAAACSSNNAAEESPTTTTTTAAPTTTTTTAAPTTTTTTAAPTTTTTAAPTTTTAPTTTVAAEEPEGPGTIVDVAVASGQFPTLVAAVQAAGLVETLSGDGPFTVFAPTEQAFADLLTSLGLTAEQVLANIELLTSVLTYHVLPQAVPASTVVTLDGQSVTTVNGADITITIDGETVMVNEATVVATDIEASNGIIHVIDQVLFPPT